MEDQLFGVVGVAHDVMVLDAGYGWGSEAKAQSHVSDA
jgi:hypothetical protein